MTRSEKEAAIEAILFTMGESVELETLAAAIEEDKKTTKEILDDLIEKTDYADRGVTIIELEGAYQMCTKGEYYETLIKVCKAPKKNTLSESMLETLSIVAYKQPVTRLDIEKIRGVNSDYSVNKLIEYGLIGEVGRMDAPGKPILFGTTEQFLRSFGVSSIEDLPQMPADQVDDFRREAEEELSVTVDI